MVSTYTLPFKVKKIKGKNPLHWYLSQGFFSRKKKSIEKLKNKFAFGALDYLFETM
jgi:hypothetical protein